MSMEQESVVDSNDVLLNDVTPASPADIQLAQSIANTRIVSQDTVYLVEDVEIETVHQINAFYRSDTGKSIPIDGATDVHSLIENKDIDHSDLTIGQLTPHHIGQQPLTGKRKDRCVPIEPIEYTDGDTTHTVYFAEVFTKNVASIHLRGDDGERQTVYKIVPDREVDTVTDYVGSTVEFGSNDETVTLHGVSTNIPDSFTSDNSLRERIYAMITDLWRTQSRVLLSLAGIWTTALLLNQGTDLISTTLLGFLSVLILVATMLVTLSVASRETTVEQTRDDSDPVNPKTTHGSITTDEHVDIALDQPAILTPQYDAMSPVTEVSVDPQFDEQSLTLTITGPEETVEWEYETNNDGVFIDTEIVDFYTELGFNILDEPTFEAYISTKKYTDDSICLVTTTGRRNLYMYPNDPTATQ